MRLISFEEAERSASRADWTAEEIIKDFANIDYQIIENSRSKEGIQHRFLQTCHETRDVLREGLSVYLKHDNVLLAAKAGCLLLLIGYQQGTDGIVRALECRELEYQERDELMYMLRTGLFYNAETQSASETIEVPVQKEILANTLIPLLTHEDFENDRRLTCILAGLQYPEASKLVRPLLKDYDPNIGIRAVYILTSWCIVDDEILDYIEAQIFPADAEDRDWVHFVSDPIVKALCMAAEFAKAHLTKRASALLERLLNDSLCQSELTQGAQALMLNALEKCESKVTFKQRLIEITKSEYSYDYDAVLTHLVRIDPINASDWVSSFIDPHVTYKISAAARVAKDQLAGTKDKELADKLVASIPVAEKSNKYVIYDIRSIIIDGIVAIGAHSVDQISELGVNIGGWTKTKVHWMANDFSAKDILLQFEYAGVIEKPTKEKLDTLEELFNENASPQLILTSLLDSGRRLYFDTETDEVPCNYVQLIEDLAIIARGVLQIDNIQQTNIEQDGGLVSYQVSYDCEEKTHSFTAKAKGDWFAVDEVLKSINQAALDAGVEWRFIPLLTNDQFCDWVFAKSKAVGEVIETLKLPLERH